MKSCLFWLNLFADLIRLLIRGLRSKTSLAAENLFLRKQLAVYQERRIKPRRTSVVRKNSMTVMQRGPRGRTRGEARSLRSAPQLGSIGRNDAAGVGTARGD
jgi:hypothetical protein